jgi:hypothetical protein
VTTKQPKAATPARAVADLAQRLTGRDPADGLTDELAGWLAGSARFRTFAEAYLDKIHKKFRGAADDPARLDVRAELQVAHLLLADRRIEVAFEAYGSGRLGPDLTFTHRAGRACNLEVTRLRRVPDTTGLGLALLAKLRQLPPSAPNAVLFAVGGTSAAALDVPGATRLLRARADAKDEPFFAGRGFEGSRSFYDRYLRLGGVVVLAEAGVGEERASLWTNGSARIAFPAAAARACLACLREPSSAQGARQGMPQASPAVSSSIRPRGRRPPAGR